MTVAVLVLGYREPAVLARVIPAYVQAGFDVYVHVDAKRPIADYAAALGGIASACVFIEPQISIFWGGFSMSRATMRLLETALKSKNYSNVLLVSDDTLPVVPVARLRSGLASHVERMSLRQISADDPFYPRYAQFYFLDHPATSLLGRPIETSFVDEAFFAAVHRLAHRRTIKKAELTLFYGSQWWCLTASTARKLIELHNTRIDIRESFEFSAVPDEIYLQSLVGNFVERPHSAESPVYVDWNRNPKPYVFTDAAGLPELDPKKHFFIRKVPSRAIGLIDYLLHERVGL